MRIVPTRLLSPSSSASNSNSRSQSPMRSKPEHAGPAADAGSGLMLKVVIMKARNLAAKDRGGTSDPYLVLTLGDSRVVTHSVPKTLNPEWNVIEELPVSSVHSLVLDVICWDKDRFGKDYMGEFDLALEEIFRNEKTEQEPRWYRLRSKRPGKKTGVVSGQVQLQFTLLDSTCPGASPPQVLDKFNALVGAVNVGSSRSVTPSMTPLLAPTTLPRLQATSSLPEDGGGEDDDDNFTELDDEPNDEGDGLSGPERAEKRKRRLRIKGLKRRRRQNRYAFNGVSDVVGIIFLEICKITDLPPESNLTRTSFDMDPFVVASLGKKTYRTRRVRHNLNPVFNEKMIFQVQGHEQTYSFSFTVIDHDKYSGNDFIASCSLPVHDLIDKAPQADPETGLYGLPACADLAPPAARARFKKLNLSRSSSSQSLGKLMRAGSARSTTGATPQNPPPEPGPSNNGGGGSSSSSSNNNNSNNSNNNLSPGEVPVNAGGAAQEASESSTESEESDFHAYVLPLKMKHQEKWESKHSPVIYLRAKYMPYPALRQQFWRAMLRQYDTDESGEISRIELTTMLDTLGSTLRDSTIDSFFHRFPHRAADNEASWDLTMDEAVICLESQLEPKNKPAAGGVGDKLKGIVPDMKNLSVLGKPAAAAPEAPGTSTSQAPADAQQSQAAPEMRAAREAGAEEDLGDDRGEEHLVEIAECPICHQPRLDKRSDSDIVTHIATCASQDWRQVNTVLMGGFVTAGPQLSPTPVALTQRSEPGTPAVESVLLPPPVVSPQASDPWTRAGLGWLRTCSAGKFCQTRRVWLCGQLTMYGASRVQAQLWGMAGVCHSGMGNWPPNWRNVICWRASTVTLCSSSWAAGPESRWGRKPYTPASPQRVSFWLKSTYSRTPDTG